jgi:hypothetical protein
MQITAPQTQIICAYNANSRASDNNCADGVMGVRSFALLVFSGNSVSTVNVNCETVCRAHSDVHYVCGNARRHGRQSRHGLMVATRNARAGAARMTTTARTLADRSIDRCESLP